MFFMRVLEDGPQIEVLDQGYLDLSAAGLDRGRPVKSKPAKAVATVSSHRKRNRKGMDRLFLLHRERELFLPACKKDPVVSVAVAARALVPDTRPRRKSCRSQGARFWRTAAKSTE